MKNAAFPVWIFLVVAALIATAAFVVGQIWPGAGMFVVIGVSTLWIAYVVRRGHARG